MHGQLGVSLVALVAVVASAGCATSVRESADATRPTVTSEPLGAASSAERLVRSVYDAYRGAVGEQMPVTLGECFISGRPCTFDVTDFVTADLAAKLRQNAVDLGFDPVVCAQNVPARITYGHAVADGSRVTIPVHTYYTMSGEVTIKVAVDATSRLITDIDCP